MTDKEKIIKELKEALDSLDITNKYRLNLIKAIEYLQEEPVSEDLEEASKKYASNNTPWDDCVNEMQESFKAGAQWQKKEFMDKACSWLWRTMFDDNLVKGFRKNMED